MKLKKRMTFEEMSQHMLENSTKVPNRVTVGKYARELGYNCLLYTSDAADD